MAALKTNKLFGGLLTSELEKLEQTCEIRRYRPGEVIFKEGDAGDGIYMVIVGAVQISAMVNPAERRVLSRIGANDFFGEMAVLDNEPRSASATAEADSHLYFIPRTEMLSMLERNPKLAVALVREFSQRMRDFNRQYIQEVLQAERLTIVGKFARSIVHDFKNPLNIIGMSAEIASLPDSSNESRQNAKARILRQVHRLTTMIAELLEFTRGSQSSVVLSPVDLSDYAGQLLEEIKGNLESKGAELEIQVPPPPVKVLMDSVRLAHVFHNLLNNAVDAMAGGGRIYVRFVPDGKAVRVEIEDTGPGIAPEIASRLFEAFATFGKPNGTGLGLSICKKIVEDHRGVIRATSQPGKGAVFTFTLPVAA
ncbi:MAG: cyclic nucleotide-binding domain-containing protein [Verrucomicrobia bacterium]|nr:cyclic nucleotide-binding domain-containing protein [Verrucomicrobiota bacterium]